MVSALPRIRIACARLQSLEGFSPPNLGPSLSRGSPALVPAQRSTHRKPSRPAFEPVHTLSNKAHGWAHSRSGVLPVPPGSFVLAEGRTQSVGCISTRCSRTQRTSSPGQKRGEGRAPLNAKRASTRWEIGAHPRTGESSRWHQRQQPDGLSSRAIFSQQLQARRSTSFGGAETPAPFQRLQEGFLARGMLCQRSLQNHEHFRAQGSFFRRSLGFQPLVELSGNTAHMKRCHSDHPVGHLS